MVSGVEREREGQKKRLKGGAKIEEKKGRGKNRGEKERGKPNVWKTVAFPNLPLRCDRYW